MRLVTSRTPTFCGVYTPNRARYLVLVRRVSGVWPEPCAHVFAPNFCHKCGAPKLEAEVVDVRAMARRALERVSQWRPYDV